MDNLVDILSATFFGAESNNSVGVTSSVLLLGLTICIVTQSWLVLYVALAGRALKLIIFHLNRFFIRRSSTTRRNAVRAQVQREQEAYERNERLLTKSDDDEWEKVDSYTGGSAENGAKGAVDPQWDGVIGFLHPFCNAGGGGERVLWAVIKATQDRYPKAVCVIYTGDHDSSKATILERVSKRFDIHLHHPTITFLYLNSRHLVVASSWPHFTLLGQAFGSIIMAYEALSLLVPDILVDTMGYAFSTTFCKLFFPEIPTGAYVHFPFIGTHMVESLTSDSGQGINAGTGKGLKGLAKTLYWKTLVGLYVLAGRSLDVVMTNSSWTKAHIAHLWGPYRESRHKPRIEAVFPPVAVEEIIDAIPLDGPDVTPREKKLLYIAQFRPEKNHELILQSFAEMIHSNNASLADAQLILVGSVRDSEDETLVYKLRLLAHELKIEDAVEFRTKDVSWPEILDWLRRAWVGVNGMWCEHFGIGVVEYQAAGLISVVNDSGGPKQDIVVDVDGGSTGYHATTAAEYAASFAKALTLPPNECNEMRLRARNSSKRFTTAVFASGWINSLEKLVDLQKKSGLRIQQGGEGSEGGSKDK